MLAWLWDNPAIRWWGRVTEPPEPVPADSPWRVRIDDWGRILARSVRGAGEDDFGMVASSIAFAAFLSILPLLSVVALTYGAIVPRETVLGHVAMMASILPEQAQGFVHDWLGRSLARREGHGIALVLSVLLTLFSGRRVGRSLLRGIDIATGVKQDRDPIAAQAVAIATVSAGALLLFAALISLFGLALISNAMPEGIPAIEDLLHLIFWLALTLGPVVVLVMIYRYVPARTALPWLWVLPGTLVAVAAWLAATLAFQVYVTKLARYDSIYGSLSAIVVLQLWLMLSAFILLFGARVNAEAMRQGGVADRE